MRDDLELLRDWRGGDAGAGQELFDRYFHQLNRFFRRKVSRGSADLAQKTFMACVEGRDRIRDGMVFRAYMYTIARRILYRELQHRARAREEPDFSVSSLQDLGVDPEAAKVDQQDERLLLEGLRRIPLDYQIALELRFWEDLRGPEIAEVLGVPEGTVRSRIRRGLERLRRELEGLQVAPVVLTTTMTRLDGWAADLREPGGTDEPG